MSSISSANEKFTITKGINNTFMFTIKADKTTLPIVIQPTDTFTASVRNLSDGLAVITKAMDVVSAENGKVSLTLSPTDTDILVAARGGVEDRYYLKPSYSLTLDCQTEANGDFLAKVPAVYVD